MNKETYEKLYNNMLASVYKNGGFYIGRYEMGIKVVNSTSEAKKYTRLEMKEYITSDNSINTAPSIEGMLTPVSKANAVPYRIMTQNQAQMLAEKVKEDNDMYDGVSTSILFGVQWDMVCVFLENFGYISDTAITNPGTKFTAQYLKNPSYGIYWGNYYYSTFKKDRGFYSTQRYSSSYNDVWYATNGTKAENTMWLCTTGASEQNKCLNIYDFSGNVEELTLEKQDKGSIVMRCVDYDYGARQQYCYPSRRVQYLNPDINSVVVSAGSRIALYIN